ncbi:DUF305 domain-containing protein [Pontibacter sp. BT310]|uniref:DUF305 domain-containing protein n=1 Tax=Pontibacter populi TaxID=890055 RepID=A0ABS6XGB2_9BACT|nr:MULTISPECIES: DUF305 domain-containing protein [Pontibacter]MBJ6120094.1 DUF305 domain-containing protein [Pontibacter sp. BT310]MBR0572527.1 DUF305 domain-containing protein [Microvirga sp. STS03]MBW3366947.1 DUF305 domain-containing protein [Pontibacter populi]
MKTEFISFKSLALMVVAIFVFSSCEKEQDIATPLSTMADQAAKGPYWENDKAFDKEMQQVINSMMKMMNQMEMTCDPDIDFANMMIMHHEMGIKMADIELKYGHEPEALELAEKTKAGNLASIARLEAFLASHPGTEPLSKEECKMFMMEMREDMMAMMHCMRSLKDTPDPDVDFAQLMICHHQGAIAMSNTELKWGDDEMALEEARIIIEEQSQEIIELSEFVNEHGVPTR